jgi:hypothetical protein
VFHGFQAIAKLKPVKQADSGCLRIWYVELRAIGERAKMGGVYAHLLMEAVVDKILNGLPPQGEGGGVGKDCQARGQLLGRHPAATGEAV